QPRPSLRGAALPDCLDDRLEGSRWDREVVDAITAGAALLVELAENVRDLVLTALVREVGGDVAHPVRELVPDVVAELVAPVLLHGLLHPLAEVVVGLLRPGHADDAELLGQEPPER